MYLYVERIEAVPIVGGNRGASGGVLKSGPCPWRGYGAGAELAGAEAEAEADDGIAGAGNRDAGAGEKAECVFHRTCDIFTCEL